MLQGSAMGQCYVVMLQGEAAVQHYGVMCGVTLWGDVWDGTTLWGDAMGQHCDAELYGDCGVTLWGDAME